MSIVVKLLREHRESVLLAAIARLGRIDTVTRFGANGVARHRTAEEFQADAIETLRAMR